MQSPTKGRGGRGGYDYEDYPWYMPRIFCALSERVQEQRDLVTSEDYVHPYPKVHSMVHGSFFGVICVLAILGNCAFIARQASEGDSLEDGGNQTLRYVFIYVEYFFTLFFMIELTLKILDRSWVWLFDRFNFCDFIVVFFCSGLVVCILVPFAGLTFLAVLRKLTVLRAIRLFQAVIHVSKREELKELGMLIHGLVHSLRVLVWVAVMIMFLLYVFAVFATELIAKDEAFRYDKEAQEHFGDVTLSMFSLFQILTLDRWSEVVRPLQAKQTWTGFFFLGFIFIASFLVINLVTAILVQQAFNFMHNDEEKKFKAREKAKHEELDRMRSIFEDLDEDGNGRLTREELEASRRHPKIQKKLRGLDISAREIDELWEILDDGDGELTIQEFVNGMKKMKGVAQARDTMYVMRNLKEVDTEVVGLHHSLDTISEEVDVIKTEVRDVHRSMGLLLRIVKQFEETGGDGSPGGLRQLALPATPIVKAGKRGRDLRTDEIPAIENAKPTPVSEGGNLKSPSTSTRSEQLPRLELPGIPSREKLKSMEPVLTEASPKGPSKKELGGAEHSVKFADPGPPASPPPSPRPTGVPKPKSRRPVSLS